MAYTVKEVREFLGISETTVYELVALGHLRSVKAGRRILIPKTVLDEFLGGTSEPTHEEIVAELSAHPHRYFQVMDKMGDSNDPDGWVSDLRSASLDEADIWTSKIRGKAGMHTIMLDLDVPAKLVPSTTPGNAHLYIDVPLPWRKYQKLLTALGDAGVLQQGYVKASIVRRCTALRLPWVKKETADD
jgi:excisionase family DNA binding protein